MSMTGSPYRSAPFEFNLDPLREVVTAIQTSIACDLAPAFGRAATALVTVMGTKAPPRRRPKRVAKKLAKRGGYMRHNSLGAFLVNW